MFVLRRQLQRRSELRFVFIYIESRFVSRKFINNIASFTCINRFKVFFVTYLNNTETFALQQCLPFFQNLKIRHSPRNMVYCTNSEAASRFWRQFSNDVMLLLAGCFEVVVSVIYIQLI